MTNDHKSYFQTHPAMRRVLWWALAMATIVLFVWLFGPETVRGWLDQVFSVLLGWLPGALGGQPAAPGA